MYFYDDEDDAGQDFSNQAENLMDEELEDGEEEGGAEPSGAEGGGSGDDPIQDAIDKISGKKNPEGEGATGDGTDSANPDAPSTEPGISTGGEGEMAEKAADLAKADDAVEKAGDVADAANDAISNPTESGNSKPGENSTGDGKKGDTSSDGEKPSGETPGGDNKPAGDKPGGEKPGGAPGGDKPGGMPGGAPGGNPADAAGKAGLDKMGVLGGALEGASEDGAKGAAKGAGKEVVKQIAKEKAKQMGLDVMMKSLASTLAPILFWVAVVILIIIIVVGLIMFFVAMPGQIIGKFKSLGNNVIKAWSAMIHGKDQIVTTSQLAETANYIEKMGYDLKGEGFVSYDKVAADIPKTIEDITSWKSVSYDTEYADMSEDDLKKLLEADPVQGVIRRNDTNAVVDINSDSILTYIISDNQCYMIKNFNVSIEGMTGDAHEASFWGTVLAVAAAVVGILVAIIVPGGFIIALLAGAAAAGAVAGVSYLAITTASNPEWGTGLISIFHEESMGVRGDYYDMKEKGSIDLDPGTKKLSVKRGWANGTYTFDIDGWSGRYGMPAEFLLSVHLATQMPDLAIDMATSFKTNVEVLLHEIDGEMTAGVLKEGHEPNKRSDFIRYATISEIGHEDQKWYQALWEGAKKAANSVAGFFSGGDKPWTDEELEKLNITDKAFVELFKKRLPHSLNCTCCSHIKGSRYVFPVDDKGNEIDNQSCSKDSKGKDNSEVKFTKNGKIDNNHKICDKCKARALRIIAALAISNDNDWESYTPYISKVTDHWFRDVYFVMNKDEGEFQNVVQVDEDYFYETGERWTLYETWEVGDSIPEGFEVGDYKLYDPSDMDNPSTKSKEEVQEINEKIANGDISVTRLVKKPITESLNANYGSDWSAYVLKDYGKDDETNTWQQISVDKNSKGELLADAVYADEDATTPDDILIYYHETRPSDIRQVEDGQRTETNPKIKKMFLDNKYYKFDGSVDRANAIMEDRKKYSKDEIKTFNQDGDARFSSSNKERSEATQKLLAKVDINKDSLSAFSMLENTHTLDADYIYRDFKELIVELNYFDKEDLADKKQEVMQWLVPDTGVAGWPIRKYEKGEDFYGTLINSKKDLGILKSVAIKDAEEELSKLESEGPAEVTKTSTVVSQVKGSILDFVNKSYDVHSQMENQSPKWDYCVLTAGSTEGQHMRASCTNLEDDTDIDTGINAEMDEFLSPIIKPQKCKRQHCDSYNSSHVCGLATSIQDAVAGPHNTCCATYVSWCLKEMGYEWVSHRAKDVYEWATKIGFKPITDYTSLKPGDLLFNKSGYYGNSVSEIGHVQILGNNGEWLNAGSKEAINESPKAYEANFIIGMRPNLNGAAAEFEGYEAKQSVVAPITGKVIEKGTVTRTNIETGNLETVGFIKIQALDHYITSSKGKFVETYCKTETSEYNPNNTYETERKEGYDYFYEEYRGVVDSCVMYIEGFDLTIDETVKNTNYKSTEVTRYVPNEVYNMTDNVKEAQALWREDAKTEAVPYFWDGSDLYIKEGTVIGKTREDTTVTITDENGKQKGNGNYIRVILRDLEDSIMEDVESYFDIPVAYSFNGSVVNLQNCDSMHPDLVALIEEIAGPLETQYPGIVNILKAISMNESSGGNDSSAGDDPMQAVESIGGKAGDSIGGWRESVVAGTNALLESWNKANNKGIKDLRVIIQGYNFGPGFVDYVASNGGIYTKELASSYSDAQAKRRGKSRYGDKDYVDPKIYKYLPDLDV